MYDFDKLRWVTCSSMVDSHSPGIPETGLVVVPCNPTMQCYPTIAQLNQLLCKINLGDCSLK
uniref:Uncharacterized protein n=1 Tax=Anguilla anguilla TaxID=7936 RepID=A0A0E9QZL6_ANGAN